MITSARSRPERPQRARTTHDGNQIPRHQACRGDGRPPGDRRRDPVRPHQDKNIGYLAEYLTALGIDLKEVRVVGDEEAEIVAGVNALRSRYDYLFTTGGIGPTHDDITAESV